MGNFATDIIPVLAAIWRRRWYALALAWFLSLFGWITVALLPDKFQSNARVYIDTTSLLGPLLKGLAVSTDFNQEVAIMQRTLLSRPNLAEVARATDLDLEATTPIEMENLLNRIERNASIKAQAQNLFTVSFTDKDPILAKAVVQSLLTIFVETNLGQNRQDMESARSFIETQLASYQKQLQEAEQRRALFHSKHANVLGGGNFTKQLAAANGARNGARRKFEDTVLRRDQLKAQLAVVPQFLKVQAPPQVVLGGVGAGLSPQENRLRQMEENLDLLRLRYTDSHPDVKSAIRVVDNLRTMIEEQAQNTQDDESNPSTPKAEIPNALYEQLQLRISELEPDLITLRRNLSDTEENVERLEELRLSAPDIEIQLQDLDRDYGIIKRKFEEFLARRESARISQAAEATTDAVQFRIISPPQVPIVPSAPKRKMLFSVVLFAAIGGGIGFTFLLSQLDTTFGSEKSLSERYNIPVLGSVSLIVTSAQKIRRTISNSSFGMALGTLLALCGALIIFAPQLTSLPDLLQKQPLPAQFSWLVDFIKMVADLSILKEI